MLLCLSSYGQSKKQERLDSLLVSLTRKTFNEYLTHFKEAEKEHQGELVKIFENHRKYKKPNALGPMIPNVKYFNKEYPYVIFSYNKEGIHLKDILTIPFDKVKILKIDTISNHKGVNVFYVKIE